VTLGAILATEYRQLADNPSTDTHSTPPAADPRAGRNPGYAETQPRDREDAQKKGPRPGHQPDEPGIERDTTEQPDPAKDRSRH
jgi:hypothetical protein